MIICTTTTASKILILKTLEFGLWNKYFQDMQKQLTCASFIDLFFPYSHLLSMSIHKFTLYIYINARKLRLSCPSFLC
jgi:hypothetical protein